MKNHPVLAYLNGYPALNNCFVKTIGRITFKLVHSVPYPHYFSTCPCHEA